MQDTDLSKTSSCWVGDYPLHYSVKWNVCQLLQAALIMSRVWVPARDAPCLPPPPPNSEGTGLWWEGKTFGVAHRGGGDEQHVVSCAHGNNVDVCAHRPWWEREVLGQRLGGGREPWEGPLLSDGVEMVLHPAKWVCFSASHWLKINLHV